MFREKCGSTRGETRDEEGASKNERTVESKGAMTHSVYPSELDVYRQQRRDEDDDDGVASR